MRYEGKVIEPGISTEGASPDELRRTLADYSLDPQRIVTQYQVVQDCRKVTKRMLDEEEQTQLRGSVAGLNWAARQGRPGAASTASVVASSFPNPTVADAKKANNTIARLKEHDVTIKIWSRPEEHLRRLL